MTFFWGEAAPWLLDLLSRDTFTRTLTTVGVSQVRKEVVPEVEGVLYEDDLWIVVHKGAPIGVAGHLQLVSKRHFQGPAHMTDREAVHLGLVLRHCEKILEQVSGAKQIYTAALGASFPHFHCHMVPVYEGRGKAVYTRVYLLYAACASTRCPKFCFTCSMREYIIALMTMKDIAHWPSRSCAL